MIKIKRNPNGDTRTAKKDVTFEEFQEANNSHKQDVRNVMDYLSMTVEGIGICHDHTKKSEEKLFYDNFISALNNGTDFVNDQWYQMHIEKERHHLLSRCPDDVTLFDVLEMVVDCVCAGLARSGEIGEIEISNKILSKAITNTATMIKNIVEVE